MTDISILRPNTYAKNLFLKQIDGTSIIAQCVKLLPGKQKFHVNLAIILVDVPGKAVENAPGILALTPTWETLKKPHALVHLDPVHWSSQLIEYI